MIPLRDNIPSRTSPWVNHVIIAVCGFVFFFQLQDDRSELVERYGMIPTRVAHPDEPVEQYIVRTPVGDQLETTRRPALPSGVTPWQTLLTCVFLHGSWMHIIGNSSDFHSAMEKPARSGHSHECTVSPNVVISQSDQPNQLQPANGRIFSTHAT